MDNNLREFQIFAKPVGATCNLGCSYCYYLGKKSLYQSSRRMFMEQEILERYIIQHIEAASDETISFSWHGGEPMMAGLEFFKTVVSFQKKHNPGGRAIINGIQTNGTLIDSEWASFFSSENFNVGLSIDGPGELHNRYRITNGKKPTLQNVLRGLDFLVKQGILFEILCVVHSENVRYPLVLYDFFKQLDAKYITFLPLVEQLSGAESGVSKKSVPSPGFGKFLCAVFNEWFENDIGNIKIQIFEEAIRPAFEQEHTLCIFKEKCGGVPVIEHNGDFYSCDHFVDKEHLIGNIKNGSVAEFLDDKKQRAFGESKLLSLPEYCKKCEVRQMCNGECPKNRFVKTPDGQEGLNYLCSSYKLFFNHCRPFVEIIAELWKRQ